MDGHELIGIISLLAVYSTYPPPVKTLDTSISTGITLFNSSNTRTADKLEPVPVRTFYKGSLLLVVHL